MGVPVADLDLSGADLVAELALPGDSADLTALVVEAGRIKDRLDRLHGLLVGDVDTWTRVRLPRDEGSVLELRVESAMQEARQLETVFRQTLAEISRRRADDGGTRGLADDLDGL